MKQYTSFAHVFECWCTEVYVGGGQFHSLVDDLATWLCPDHDGFHPITGWSNGRIQIKTTAIGRSSSLSKIKRTLLAYVHKTVSTTKQSFFQKTLGIRSTITAWFHNSTSPCTNTYFSLYKFVTTYPYSLSSLTSLSEIENYKI